MVSWYFCHSPPTNHGGTEFNPQGKPRSEMHRAGQPPRILSPEEQEKMRTVCRVSTQIWEGSITLFILMIYLARERGPRYRCLPCQTWHHYRRNRRDRAQRDHRAERLPLSVELSRLPKICVHVGMLVFLAFSISEAWILLAL